VLSRFNFNHYILLSEKWLTKIALLWCGFSVLLGFVVQVEIALIIAAPLMTLCMFFAGMILSSSLIGFQKINPFAKSNPNFIKFAILLFCFFGLLELLQRCISCPQEFFR